MKIETERLILRPFCEDDAVDVFAYLAEPTVNCFACMKQESVESTRRDLIERAKRGGECYAIVLKAENKVIGEIEAHAESAAPGPGAVMDTYSPCWMLNPAYQGKGYAFEAAQAFFEHLFSTCGARRIYAYTEDYNLPSQHLCEKLGMRREGIFMEFVSFVNKPDGTPLYENTMQYAILKHEWEARA